jgi:AAA15 family ATPase/GTPase
MLLCPPQSPQPYQPYQPGHPGAISMIKEYTISNFKAFSTPATLPIKPITLIYGANSAGKSSIFQSLLLLKQSLKHERVEASEGSMPSSLVTNGKYIQLNTFNNIVHNNEDEKQIEFEFYFSTKKLLKLFSSIKLPKQTVRLIDLFAKNFEKIGVSLNFSNQVQLKNNSNIINELRVYADDFKEPLLYYEFHDIDDAGICTMGGGFSLDSSPDSDVAFFWDIYWESIGKDRSVNIVKKLLSIIHEEKVRIVKNTEKFDYDEKFIASYFSDHEDLSYNDLNKIVHNVDENDKILKEILNDFYSPYYYGYKIQLD